MKRKSWLLGVYAVVLVLVMTVPALSATSLGFAWQHDDLATIDKFVIERSIDNEGTWTSIANIPVPVLSFTYTTTEEGMRHCYRIFAMKGTLSSVYFPLQSDPTHTSLCFDVPVPFVVPPGHSFRGGTQ